MSNEIKVSTSVAEAVADDLDRAVAVGPHSSRSDLIRYLIEEHLYGKTRVLNLLKNPAQQKAQTRPD